MLALTQQLQDADPGRVAERLEELGLQLVQRRAHRAVPSPTQRHVPTGRSSARRIHPLVKNMRPILACGTGRSY
ncbi:hypothetical protein GCM10010251_96010 [Streptomyces aurantiogriseus]|uniref:Uncharacterized protein n=1 Tax=Streptomyces aurantiogriseus TaxID=66870 RepID=A0A918FPF6_9ACTN|nr:hypothetical protein GCM10010251_96010 [Streptomyces aurantiogriseus]